VAPEQAGEVSKQAVEWRQWADNDFFQTTTSG